MLNQKKTDHPLKKIVEALIFSTRWLLIPFLLMLSIPLLVYLAIYTKEIFHFLLEWNKLDINQVIALVLEFIDIVMIANLIKMIITGSYNSFISKDHGVKNENFSSGVLKVKISTSLMGVCSIILLQDFIKAEVINWDILLKKLAIFGAFIIGSYVLAQIDYIHEKAVSVNPGEEH